jgi:hypothetical protein
MNQQQAERKLKDWRCDGWVFQYPKGHWGAASKNSPVGLSLVHGSYIYPELGVKALQVIEINRSAPEKR